MIRSEWVREIVCAWIMQVEDKETLRDWFDAIWDRLCRLDGWTDSHERVVTEVTRGCKGWRLDGLSQSSEGGRTHSGLHGSQFTPKVSTRIETVTLVYKREILETDGGVPWRSR